MRSAHTKGWRRSAAATVGLLSLVVAACLANCTRKPTPPRGVVLVSGHEPFGGLERNTSWEVARRLDGDTVAGLRVVAVRLPVVWEECGRQIREAVRRHRPRAVLATGVAWQGLIQVETTARNERRPHKDNRKELPRRKLIEPGGPRIIATHLPAERIVKRLRALGLPAETSDDAGGYICNETFYSLLRETAQLEEELGERVPAGFIHLPRAGRDRAKKATGPERTVRAVTVDDLVRGIRAAIEEAAAARRSPVEAAGPHPGGDRSPEGVQDEGSHL